MRSGVGGAVLIQSSKAFELASYQHGAIALYNSLILLHFAQKLQAKKALYLPEATLTGTKSMYAKTSRNAF